MSNPYAAPQSGLQESAGPVVCEEGFTQDLSLVRQWLGVSWLPLLGLAAGVSASMSLLMDLQAWYAPETSSTPLSVLSGVANIALAGVAVRVAVGRWRSPEAPVGEMIQDGLQRVGPMIGPVFLRGLGTVLATLFFLVPGVVVAARTMTLEGLYLLGWDRQGRGGLAACWALSEGKTMSLLGSWALGMVPLVVMGGIEGGWQLVAYDQGVSLPALLAISTPLAAVRGAVSLLLPLLGAARVVTWMQALGPLHFPWEGSDD